MSNIGKLVKTVKKGAEWIIIDLPGGDEIRILISTQGRTSAKYQKIVILCPRELKIDTEFIDEDSVGNH